MTRTRRRIGTLAGGLAVALWLVAALLLPPWGADAALPGGLPVAAETGGRYTWVRVLESPGFLTGYSEIRAAPIWVAYRSGHITDPAGPPRPDRFNRDWRVFRQPAPDALRGTAYGRGHLAPNYAISRLYGRDAQLATFRMSNIVAQRHAMNRGVWQRIEELETDQWAAETETLWVVTGPVFDAQREWVGDQVEVPDALYRVLLARDDDGGLRALAFVVPQQAATDADLRNFVVTIDAVEQATGLDLFAGLPDAVEITLEREEPTDAWRLDQLATRPGRYAN